MNKKILSLVLAGMLTIGTMVGCSSTKSTKKSDIKITMVLDEGGVNDQSFNQSAWEGAKQLMKDYPNLDISYIESHQEADYMSNIETAVDNDSDMVIGVGFKIASTLKKAAEVYPETDFLMVDNVYDETPENVQTISFDEEQSGYLAGLIAAKTTKTNKVGFIGGMNIPTCSRFADGFEKALKEVNPEIQFYKQFTNSFTDAAKSKLISLQMVANDADIIFAASGGGNIGIFETAREKNIKVIGVDSPNSYIAPEAVLTSAIKNVGQGIYNSVESYLNKEFKGGQNVKYDISSGAVTYEDTDLISQDIRNFVNNKIEEMK